MALPKPNTRGTIKAGGYRGQHGTVMDFEDGIGVASGSVAGEERGVAVDLEVLERLVLLDEEGRVRVLV